MKPDQSELADVVRRFEGRLYERCDRSVSCGQRRALRDIAACRTAALGGHVEECQSCGHRQITYNSCRNRHCPKCQAGARAEWLAAREGELLPVPYFHVVFTLPSQLSELALGNPRTVYGLLFRAAAQTLLQVARNPKWLGAQIGFLAVLHTWGQNLMHHPHVHCVIPAGGISLDGRRWVAGRKSGHGKDFFLPVRVVSRVFRGKFVGGLKQLFQKGRLRFSGSLSPLAQHRQFERWLNQIVRQDWVVYAKRPFGGPQQVLKYLARYTHRVAISNRRLVEVGEERVSFQYKDYADGSRTKVMTLDGVEFLRRFLMHVLPQNFVRIRHYGWMANRDRGRKLAQCRRLLGLSDAESSDGIPQKPVDRPCSEEPELAIPCLVCRIGRMLCVEILVAPASRLRPPHFFVRVAANRMRVDTS